jgi:hypothetical protein
MYLKGLETLDTAGAWLLGRVPNPAAVNRNSSRVDSPVYRQRAI